MTWFSIILAVLELANKLFEYGLQQKWINEGQALAVAKASAEILRKTNYAKEIMAEVNNMSESTVDDELHHLEPGQSGDGNRQLLSDISTDNKTKR